MWFTTMYMLALILYQIWLYFCSIISLYFCKILYKSYVWEFGEESVRKWFSRLVRNWLVIVDPWNKPREKHMLKFEESMTSWISRITRDSGQVASGPQNSLPIAFWSDFSHSLPTLYKPSLPTKYKKNEYFLKKLLREKP